MRSLAAAGRDIIDTDISALPAGYYLVSAGTAAVRLIKR